MKKKLLIITLILANLIFAQNVNIPDVNFKAYLLNNSAINTNGDSEIQITEASAYTGYMDCSNRNISDLTGIEAFTAFYWLSCKNNQLTSLDLSQNTALEYLNCDSNQLISLDLGQNTVLEYLYCSFNQLTSLDLSQNTALKYLNCFTNQLTSLDVSQNTALEYFDCKYNQLTSLDLSQNTALIEVYCLNNQLTSLNVSQSTALTKLYCYSNQLTSLDVSQNSMINVLSCYGNLLTNLDVSQNTLLTQLYCHYNQFTSLDVSQNTVLNVLYCQDSQLTSLNVANGNNQNMTNDNFRVYLNPNLTCIQVDNEAYSTTNWLNKDATASYSTTCALKANDFDLSEQITVYPNPVKNSVYVKLNTQETISKIQVVTLDGRVVACIENKTSIAIDTVNSGVYLLKITTKEGKTAIQKIIKE
ncbi:T9SS type A sorting domain-containing protein [Flavobacterium sp. TP390]|uniref:T9SS type A sorting domain-containing protein n=1 Tax=Flavobacterium profundi TaxID=1774945 RepID=A0A6I4IKW9_9FLAO|nr:leucine-rich repeat domain-containing protein [Flavobacterium profundi]MVO08881.1 T9SS type A sorting domain-containing protein [Flavobacterium profundi]